MLGFTGKKEAENWSDEKILAASQGEPWLFEILVDRYQAAFTRKVQRIIFNPLDVEEVVQDAFVKIYHNADKYQDRTGAKFSSWAYRILLNTAFTRYQKLTKENERFAAIDPEFEALLKDDSEVLVVKEKSDGVERILLRLPDHFALVLRLHYLERWPHQDIAKKTGENVGTIKARIHRAKAAFRKEAKGEEIDNLL